MRPANLEGWPWLGAPLAIDLANSLVRIRPGETRDLLLTEAELDEWLRLERDRLPAPRRTAARLGEFRALRDALYAALSAAAAGSPPPSKAVAAINGASARSDGHLRLVRAPEAATAERAPDTAPEPPAPAPAIHHLGSGTPLDRALSAIARSAIELLAGPDRARLRVCPAPSCGMFYLGRPDQAWCSTACGNRARAARHYARRRRATTTPRI